MGTLLKIIGLGVIIYGIWYFFFRKPKYQFTKDYTIALNASEIVNTPNIFNPNTNFFPAKMGSYTFKKGDVIQGIDNKNGTFTITLSKLGRPDLIRVIPINGNLVLVSKWF